MRKLLIRLVILLVILAVGGFIWLGLNANALVAKHKDDIEAALSQTLKTDVKVGGIAVSVFPQTTLTISNFDLGGGVRLDGVKLRVSPLALLSGTIKVNELEIDSPTLTLVQTKSGFVVQGLPSATNSAATQGSDSAIKPKQSTQSGGGASPINIALESFSLTDGSIKLEMLPPAKPIVVKNIAVSSGLNVTGTTIALSNLKSSMVAQDIKLGAKAANIKLDSATHAVESRGLILETPAGEIAVDANLTSSSDGTIRVVSATPLSLSRVSSLITQLSPTTKNLTGTIGLNLTATMRQSGTIDQNGDITLSDIGGSFAQFIVEKINGKIALSGTSTRPELSADSIELLANGQKINIALSAGFDSSTKRASLSRLKINGFEGNVLAQGSLGISDGSPISIDSSMDNLSIGALVSVLNNPGLPKVEGKIQKVSAKISTISGNEMIDRLSGEIVLDVRDGSLPGVNFLGPVLKAVSTIPLLTGHGSVPPAVTAAANSPDTAFKAISGGFQIVDGVARTENFVLIAPLFDLKASGSIALNGQIGLKASIFLEPGLSAALAGKEAKKILDQNGRLEVPLGISGKPGAISVTPDVNRLLQTAAGKALEDKAINLLDKALGGKKGGKGLFGF